MIMGNTMPPRDPDEDEEDDDEDDEEEEADEPPVVREPDEHESAKAAKVSLDGSCRCVCLRERCAASSGNRTRCLFLFERTA